MIENNNVELLFEARSENEAFARVVAAAFVTYLDPTIEELQDIKTAVSEAHYVIYVCIALIGFGNSNVFPIIFAQALTMVPDKKNEVSGLMIMGLFGGTVFPLLMGVASDAVGQNGAVAVMSVGVIYLIIYTLRLKK